MGPKKSTSTEEVDCTKEALDLSKPPGISVNILSLNTATVNRPNGGSKEPAVEPDKLSMTTSCLNTAIANRHDVGIMELTVEPETLPMTILNTPTANRPDDGIKQPTVESDKLLMIISSLNSATASRSDDESMEPAVESDKLPMTISVCDHPGSNDTKKQHHDLSDLFWDGMISSMTNTTKEPTESSTEKECSNSMTGKSSDKQTDRIHVTEEESEIELDKTQETEPKDFLHLVNLDHQYLSASGTSNWKLNVDQREDAVYNERPSNVTSYTVKLSNKPEPFHGRLRQILTTAESGNKTLDTELQTNIPNAALIQKHFQDMLAMTSLYSIEEPDATAGTKERCVPNIEKEEDSDSDSETVSGAEEDTGLVTTDEEDQSEEENEEILSNKTTMRVGVSDSCGSKSGDIMAGKIRQTSKSFTALGAPVVTERNIVSRFQCDIDDSTKGDPMLGYVFDKLLQRWAEYLQLSPVKLLAFEQKNFPEETSTEVIEMLEDKGRYVWQLLEDILNSKEPI